MEIGGGPPISEMIYIDGAYFPYLCCLEGTSFYAEINDLRPIPSR